MSKEQDKRNQNGSFIIILQKQLEVANVEWKYDTWLGFKSKVLGVENNP